MRYMYIFIVGQKKNQKDSTEKKVIHAEKVDKTDREDKEKEKE